MNDFTPRSWNFNNIPAEVSTVKYALTMTILMINSQERNFSYFMALYRRKRAKDAIRPVDGTIYVVDCWTPKSFCHAIAILLSSVCILLEAELWLRSWTYFKEFCKIASCGWNMLISMEVVYAWIFCEHQVASAHRLVAGGWCYLEDVRCLVISFSVKLTFDVGAYFF